MIRLRRVKGTRKPHRYAGQMIICNRKNATFEVSDVGKKEANKRMSEQSPSLGLRISIGRGAAEEGKRGRGEKQGVQL